MLGMTENLEMTSDKFHQDPETLMMLDDECLHLVCKHEKFKFIHTLQ